MYILVILSHYPEILGLLNNSDLGTALVARVKLQLAKLEVWGYKVKWHHS